MSKQTEALKLALEALKQIDEAMPFPVAKLAQKAIREALAEQPVQVDPCIDGSCSCCWTHLDEQPAQQQEPVTNCRHCGGPDTVLCAGQCKAQQQRNDSEHVSTECVEPVAFTRKRMGYDREYCEKPFTTDWTPLYKSPRQNTPSESGITVAWGYLSDRGIPVKFHDNLQRKRMENAIELGGLQLLYTSPPPRKPWVWLTPAEVHDIWCYNHTPQEVCDAVSAKLKEKNNG